jgi:hypothetical protein
MPLDNNKNLLLFPKIPQWNRSETEPGREENLVFSGKRLHSPESKRKIPYSTEFLSKRKKLQSFEVPL